MPALRSGITNPYFAADPSGRDGQGKKVGFATTLSGRRPARHRYELQSATLPRTITHDKKLRRTREDLDRFLDESAGLGARRGPLLVQLPPSLAYDARVAGRFFDLLRERHAGAVVCEPRHPTWFSRAADRLLVRQAIARVAADPAPAPGAEQPGGWTGLVYYRLHGSPQKYWSRYERPYVDALALALRAAAASADAWCIFDNTASGPPSRTPWDSVRRRLKRPNGKCKWHMVSPGHLRRCLNICHFHLQFAPVPFALSICHCHLPFAIGRATRQPVL